MLTAPRPPPESKLLVLNSCVNEVLLYNRAPIGTDCWPTVELVLISADNGRTGSQFAINDQPYSGRSLIGGVVNASALIAVPVSVFCLAPRLHCIRMITFMEIRTSAVFICI